MHFTSKLRNTVSSFYSGFNDANWAKALQLPAEFGEPAEAKPTAAEEKPSVERVKPPPAAEMKPPAAKAAKEAETKPPAAKAAEAKPPAAKVKPQAAESKPSASEVKSSAAEEKSPTVSEQPAGDNPLEATCDVISKPKPASDAPADNADSCHLDSDKKLDNDKKLAEVKEDIVENEEDDEDDEEEDEDEEEDYEGPWKQSVLTVSRFGTDGSETTTVADFLAAGPPRGLTWQRNGRNINDGLLYGEVDSEGRFTGDNITYVYPDLRTGLRGTFRDGELVAGTEVRIVATRCRGGLKELLLVEGSATEDSGESLTIWRREDTNATWLGSYPRVMDPHERRSVYVGQSAIPGSGEGLFARRSFLPGELVAYYR